MFCYMYKSPGLVFGWVTLYRGQDPGGRFCGCPRWGHWKIRIILILNIQAPLPFVNTFSQVFAIRTNKPLILPHSAQRDAATEKEKSTRMADTMGITQACVSLQNGNAMTGWETKQRDRTRRQSPFAKPVTFKNPRQSKQAVRTGKEAFSPGADRLFCCPEGAAHFF